MHTGLAVLLGLMLTFLHQGNVATNTQITAQLDVTPTVDPSVTPTVSPTETPTVTPTETPTVTPTTEPSTTPTVTPTASPSVTPTVTPPCEAPDEGHGNDDLLGIKANIHAFFGLMNAAFRHERNEARFVAKHCVEVEENEQDNDKKGEGE